MLEYSPVSTAATPKMTAPSQTTREDVQHEIEFQLYGAIAATGTVLPAMRAAGAGAKTSTHCGSVTLYRIEFGDQPAAIDLVQSYPHGGRGVGRRVLSDDHGLVDENQHHGVVGLG